MDLQKLEKGNELAKQLSHYEGRLALCNEMLAETGLGIRITRQVPKGRLVGEMALTMSTGEIKKILDVEKSFYIKMINEYENELANL